MDNTMYESVEYLHNILKIQYVNQGYLPDLPYHLISERELFNAFFSYKPIIGTIAEVQLDSGTKEQIVGVVDIENPSGFLIDTYPCIYGETVLYKYTESGIEKSYTVADAYHDLLVRIAFIIENYLNYMDIKHSAGHVVEGDVNMNGTLDINDIWLIRRVIAGLDSLSEAQFIIADVNKDGIISLKDVLRLRQLYSPSYFATELIPDWVYSYMLGIVVGSNSNIKDRHDLLALLGTDNIDDEIDAVSVVKCYKTSKAWLNSISSGRKDCPTIFGEPHVIKALRLNNLNM